MSVEEYGLPQALSPLAQVTKAIGARSVSVVVFEKGGLLAVVYQWPEALGGSADLRLKAEAVVSEASWEETVSADSTLGQFLARATNSAGSFFLVPWPDRQWKVIIAFGIPSCESRTVIAEEFSPVIQLAALSDTKYPRKPGNHSPGPPNCRGRNNMSGPPKNWKPPLGLIRNSPMPTSASGLSTAN